MPPHADTAEQLPPVEVIASHALAGIRLDRDVDELFASSNPAPSQASCERRTHLMANFDFLKAVDWPEIHCRLRSGGELRHHRSRVRPASTAAARSSISLTTCMTFWGCRFRTRMICRRGSMMPTFKAKVGAGIATKLNLIRKLGNHAVHDQKPIPPRAALDALRELHHVMVWAAFHHSANPAGGAAEGGVRSGVGGEGRAR